MNACTPVRTLRGLSAVVLVTAMMTVPAMSQDALASRIAHTDPSKYVFSESAHQGAPGGYRRVTLLGSRVIATVLAFMRESIARCSSMRRSRPS